MLRGNTVDPRHVNNNPFKRAANLVQIELAQKTQKTAHLVLLDDYEMLFKNIEIRYNVKTF